MEDREYQGKCESNQHDWQVCKHRDFACLADPCICAAYETAQQTAGIVKQSNQHTTEFPMNKWQSCLLAASLSFFPIWCHRSIQTDRKVFTKTPTSQLRINSWHFTTYTYIYIFLYPSIHLIFKVLQICKQVVVHFAPGYFNMHILLTRVQYFIGFFFVSYKITNSEIHTY